MPIDHILTLREGESGEEELKVVEASGLAPWDRDAALTLVGTRQPRVEGVEKVTGRARYTYDIRLPGQLYGAILRCPYAHAVVKEVDVSRAEALPGVHAVLYRGNTPDIPWYEQSRLFDDQARFVGEEVAIVAAESEEIAGDALRLIEVTYEVLPHVLEMEEALAPGAPPVHEGGNEATKSKTYSRGDVEQGLGEADVVVEAKYVTQTAIHNALEPHGCTAFWQGNIPGNEELLLYVSTQGIFEVREMVAEKLGLALHDVRVVKQHMGGGFGAKQVAWKQTVLAALLSKRTGRPVQVMLDREAECLAVGNRNATRQRVRVGAKADGTLTALVLDCTVAVGAYMVGGEASHVGGPYERLYRCPNVSTRQVNVYVNTGPTVAFRAPGYVEGAWGLEQALDELALRLEMDPLALRLKNYAGHDQKKGHPYTMPEALRIAYDKGAEAFGWYGYERSPETGGKRRGIGVAAQDWGGAGHAPGYAWIKLNNDGTADVVTGTQDIGTGTRTGLAQVAAEELGLPLADVAVYLGDTARGPYSPTSAGSATTPTLAPAVRAAAADVRKQLLRIAAKVLEVGDGQLEVRDGVIREVDRPENQVAVKEVMARIAPHMLLGEGMRGPNPAGKSVRTFGVQFVEVEVDVETGEVTVLRVVASHDSGRIINHAMVDSQVQGGVVQGIGFGLTEERVTDRATGIVLNAGLEFYKVPTIADVPPISHHPVDMADPEANEAGVKGVGEPPIIPTAPALANAIYDAVGIRMREAPITRQRLLAALYPNSPETVR